MIDCKYLTKLPLIIFFAMLLLTVQSCMFSAGNIGYTVLVPHNLKKSIYEKYSDKIINKYGYQIPKEYDSKVLKYDHIDVYNYYFKDEPEAIYRIAYTDITYVISIYYPEEKVTVNRKSQLSKKEKAKIEERVMNKIIIPMWEMAKSDNLSPTEIYFIEDCESFLKCKR